MRLSEYRRHLAKIARQQLRQYGHDPEVASPKWSSTTLAVRAPYVEALIPKPDGEWLDEVQQTPARLYVIVGDTE